MPQSQPKSKEPLHGETWELKDGRKVTVLRKTGNAYRVVNQAGRIEIVYPGQFIHHETHKR